MIKATKLSENKKINYLPYFIGFCLFLWVGLFIARAFNLHSPDKISTLAAQLEFVAHLLILPPLFIIYKRISGEDKRIFGWFVLANLGLFANDLTFYLVTYLHSSGLINVSFLPFLLNLIPFYIWVVAFGVFFIKILRRDILRGQRYAKLLYSFIIINGVIISLFLSTIHYAFGILSTETITQVSTFVVQLIIFDFTILCLIYSENWGITCILLGIIVLISGDFFLVYSIISQTNALFSYGELLWFLGLLFMLFGVLIIEKNGHYQIGGWFRKNTAIKSKLAFWSFSISIISFLLFFMIAFLFSIISRQVFLGLPLFIMIYSAIVVILSIYMSQRFEAPFKKLAENVDALMRKNVKIRTNTKISSIEEFVILQQFIAHADELKEAKDKAERELGDVTAQAAHDIRSPLVALNTSLKHLPQIPEKQRILMRNAASRINDIANNLLEQYRGNEAFKVSQNKVWLLAPLLESIISEKRMQLEGRSIDLIEEISNTGFAVFAQFDATEMKRLLSNLMNNAAEAFGPSGGKITVLLAADDEFIDLRIKDNGCGIPQDKLKEVLKPGVSFKEGGSGLGLPHAKETIEAWGGEMQLHSALGRGTEILLKLPRASAPGWFVSEIRVSPEIPIGILDDDQSVHDAWDQALLVVSKELDIQHFKTPAAFAEWYTEKSGLIQVFSDYELLGESETGLDVLEKLKIGGAGILVTSHYENPEIIKRCEAAGIRLLPKNLLAHIPIKLIPTDIAVELVLIDDNTALRRSWELSADFAGKKMLSCASPSEFELYKAKLDRSTPIYIDSELEAGIKGEEYAKILFDAGFKEIYLVTGYEVKDFGAMPWIREIRDKTPPF